MALSELIGKITEKDREHAKLFVRIFLSGKHTGKQNAISNTQIRVALKRYFNVNIGDAKVRQLIAYVRNTGLVKDLCASIDGYYVAANTYELNEYLVDLFGRIHAQLYMFYSVRTRSSFQGLIEIPFEPTDEIKDTIKITDLNFK